MSKIEQHALRAIVCAACVVPIGAGAGGILLGPGMFPSTGVTTDLDSHFRYLSGLLLGVGLAFLSTVPRIERHEARFRLLTCIVVAGGVGRLIAMLTIGIPSAAMVAALAMELIVTPGLALWQRRVAHAGNPH